MQTKQFSIKEAFTFGFKKTYEHIGLIISAELLFLGAWLILPLLMGIATLFNDTSASSYFLFIPSSIKTIFTIILIIALIAGVCVLTTFVQGLRRIMLDIYDQNASSATRITSQVGTFFTFAIANFLYVIMVQFGLLLFVLPGLYLSTKYGFYTYCLADDNSLDPVEALKRSSQLTKGVINYLFLYNILWLTLYSLAFLSLIGWIILLPALFLSDTYVYRELIQQTEQ